MSRRVAAGAALLSCVMATGAAVLSGAAPAAAVAPATVATVTRDGVSFRYSRVDRPVVAHPRGRGVTRSDFDGDGRDDLAVTAGSTNFVPGQDRYDLTGSVTVTYSAAAHQDTFTGILQPQGGAITTFHASRGELVPGSFISGRTVTSSAIVKLDHHGYTLP